MKSLQDRFLAKVNKTEFCWNWNAAKTSDGYGRIGKGGKEGKTCLAHRIAWELFIAPVPEGLIVCHQCDNPSCVRPEHLFLGTSQSNMRDRDAKGRNAFGMRTPWAKLTDDAVRDIRQRGGEAIGALAKEYNVSHAAVWKVLTNRSWRSVH